MLTRPRQNESLSAVEALKQWWQKLPSGRSASLSDIPPPRAISTAEQGGGRGFDLLLIRMEALRLEPGEMRRIEAAVFHDLAETCNRCQSKDQCEQDLVYLLAGVPSQDWESYCPNAAILNAMSELSWFGERSATCGQEK